MQNSMTMFTFSILEREYPFWINSDLTELFGYIWSTNLKLLVQHEIWYQDQLKYAKSNDGVNCMCFRLEIEYIKFNGDVFFFCFRPFFVGFVQKYVSILMLPVMSWKFICRDLKPVAFLAYDIISNWFKVVFVKPRFCTKIFTKIMGSKDFDFQDIYQKPC